MNKDVIDWMEFVMIAFRVTMVIAANVPVIVVPKAVTPMEHVFRVQMVGMVTNALTDVARTVITNNVQEQQDIVLHVMMDGMEAYVTSSVLVTASQIYVTSQPATVRYAKMGFMAIGARRHVLQIALEEFVNKTLETVIPVLVGGMANNACVRDIVQILDVMLTECE